MNIGSKLLAAGLLAGLVGCSTEETVYVDNMDADAKPGELAQLWTRADEVFKYGKRSALRPFKGVFARHEMLKKPEA